MFQNIYCDGIKKLMFEILKDKYHENELVIERLAATVTNPKDYEMMGKLLVTLYEKGFLRAVDEHKEIMKRSGMEVNIVPSKTTIDSTIFGKL